ncbi:tetratricopeptide repeat protein [Pseudomonas akapageensis]|uniref:tetratricopeptide repeat protein n=1 Tax=Pseudomonas akapageensis TaxID=2609961 RepID=UPI001409E344|nr:tetratricopeptide repeat protein [Pseudomonas akapageensis]
MFVETNIYSMLARLLPESIIPAPGRPGYLQRLYASVGLPAQRALMGESFTLVARLDEAACLQTVYLDLRQQALGGSVTALNDLGWIWLNGKYWVADHELARQLLRMAAVQGSGVACYNLGQQCYFGKGVPVAYASAADYYRLAFDRGFVQAAAALGDLYEEEVCTDDLAQPWQVDLQQAYRWFDKGARKGDARCRFEVGYRLLHGIQVAPDRKAGVYWLELAAVAGVMAAAEELAVYFSLIEPSRPYRFWRDQAIALGSELALTMKLDDQVQPSGEK